MSTARSGRKLLPGWQAGPLCAVRVDDEEVRAYADKLYEDLQNAGIGRSTTTEASEPACLPMPTCSGIPLRIIVSPKNMKQGVVVEVASRG